jgi:hypothetical protein
MARTAMAMMMMVVIVVAMVVAVIMIMVMVMMARGDGGPEAEGVVRLGEGIGHRALLAGLEIDDGGAIGLVASAVSAHQTVSNSKVLTLSSSPLSRTDRRDPQGQGA